MEDSVKRIQQKLFVLQRGKTNWPVEGTNRKRFELYPCLSESTIRDFELRNQVDLPQDYRTFLLKIGNGGGGPWNGLRRLHDSYTLGAQSTDFLICRNHSP